MRRSSLWNILVLISASLTTLCTARAGEIDRAWIRGIYTGGSPRPIALSEPEAWQRASDLAAHTPGAFVLVGTGESMQPLYQPNTILVLQQQPYAKIARGQTAIYRSKKKKTVAHVLIAKARDGWRSAGLNNATHDMEPVVAENLVGVVIAAFAPQESSPSVQIARRN